MRTSELPVVVLKGSGFARGRKHGLVLKARIQELIAAQSRQLAARIGTDCAEAVEAEKAAFLETQHHEDAIDAWCPDLMDEVEGIADGAETTVADILFLNLTDEYWAYSAKNQAVSEVNSAKCTSFGIADQTAGRVWSGQNMDVGSWCEGFQTLFWIEADEDAPEALVLGRPGCLGLCGLNTANIGVACNTLLTLQASARGLPVAFVVRHLLTYQCVDEAIAFLISAPHASGQNYLLSSHEAVKSFEACASGVEEYVWHADTSRIFHTNHPLANQNCNAFTASPSSLASTHARLASIAARLGNNDQQPTLQDIKAALSARDNPDYPVSRLGDYQDADIGYTFASLIYELSDSAKLHIASGPPCQTDWCEFDLKDLSKQYAHIERDCS